MSVRTLVRMGTDLGHLDACLMRVRAHRNSHHGQQRVRTACLSTLQDLRLEYLDLYLVRRCDCL